MLGDPSFEYYIATSQEGVVDTSYMVLKSPLYEQLNDNFYDMLDTA